MSESWSEKISQRFSLTLPPDLVAWLDDELWRRSAGAEFRHPQAPEQLLQPDEGVIWSGFMQPDTLPIVGNDYGDWLSLRVAPDGSITEVVYWCHGGGDWIPYGRSLAEALVYDAAFAVLYPRRPELEEPESRQQKFAAVQWARDWLPTSEPLPCFWDDPTAASNATLLSDLAQAGICEVAARRDLILRDLESPLKARSNPQVAKAIGASWEPDFVSWIFDTALIPELRKGELKRHFSVSISELTQQDWDAAENQALKVIQLRQDLGWAFDIAGWAAERRGDIQQAVEHYRLGVQASAFADDSVRFRTHWFMEGFGKFAAARLYELRDHLPDDLVDHPYLLEFWNNDPETLRPRIRDYWLGLAEQAEREQRYADAYRLYYYAGWDCGLQFVKSYQVVLDSLIRTAKLAGFSALAEIAQMHQQYLD